MKGITEKFNEFHNKEIEIEKKLNDIINEREQYESDYHSFLTEVKEWLINELKRNGFQTDMYIFTIENNLRVRMYVKGVNCTAHCDTLNLPLEVWNKEHLDKEDIVTDNQAVRLAEEKIIKEHEYKEYQRLKAIFENS